MNDHCSEHDAQAGVPVQEQAGFHVNPLIFEKPTIQLVTGNGRRLLVLHGIFM